jgi:signal transduction histidine kinase
MAAGDATRGSDYYERALAAQARETMQRARDRTTALQLRLDAERARAEADHNRKLAATLADMNTALEHLGSIGREMTADLDMRAVLRSIASHCRRLLTASFVDIWIGRAPGQLERIAGIAVDGVERVDLARHAADTRAVVEDGIDWATPLLAGDRLIGVLAIRRDSPLASDRERAIFAALAAYGAIALDNGQAYRDLGRALGDLRRTQAELVQQQKHAALGQLVAGVAHEVNTPIGIALTAASHSIDASSALAIDLDAQRVRVSDVKRVLRDLNDGNRIIVSALERAGRIIDRFKQVAGDAASDPRRRFAVAPRIEGVVAALKPRLDGRGIAVRASCPPATTLDSYPETLSRVLEQLIDNALIHGFGDDQPGQVEIRVTEADDQIEVLVADTGRGIGDAHRHLVFEPFFTTSRATGGTGLGLPIVYNLVTGTLGGVIAVDSAEGLGTRVTLTLPRSAA